MVKVSWLKNSGINSVNDFKDGISACATQVQLLSLTWETSSILKTLSMNQLRLKKQTKLFNDAGRCDTYTTDKSGLAAQRTKLSAPDDHKYYLKRFQNH